jgi:hypothetical protein
MSSTTVALTFANRKYDPEVIELIHAWDIDGFMENPTGYEDTKREAIASLGSDLLRWVTVEVDIPNDAIRSALLGELPTQRSSEPVITDASSEREGQR